jgi:hypothetical protein
MCERTRREARRRRSRARANSRRTANRTRTQARIEAPPNKRKNSAIESVRRTKVETSAAALIAHTLLSQTIGVARESSRSSSGTCRRRSYGSASDRSATRPVALRGSRGRYEKRKSSAGQVRRVVRSRNRAARVERRRALGRRSTNDRPTTRKTLLEKLSIKRRRKVAKRKVKKNPMSIQF